MARKSSQRRDTLVLLVRHGHTPTTGKVLPGRARGLHLSETGQAQAKAVAERLASLPRIDAVYTSPMERAKETAKPIAAACGLRPTVDKGLLEADIGEWTGLAISAVAKTREWRSVQRYPSGFRFPGGESFPEVQQRVVGTVERLRAAHTGQAIVLVSHADPIKLLVAHAVGTHLDLFQRIAVSTCSVTAISYGDGGPTVLSVNSVNDLGAFRAS